MSDRDYQFRDVMSAPVVTIQPAAALVDAAVLLRGNAIRHLPVLAGGKLVGLLSDRDIQRFTPSRLIPINEETYNLVFADATVERVMTRAPQTVSSGDPLLAAIALMQQARCGCLPVVDDVVRVGIITRGDLLDALQRLLLGKSAARAKL